MYVKWLVSGLFTRKWISSLSFFLSVKCSISNFHSFFSDASRRDCTMTTQYHRYPPSHCEKVSISIWIGSSAGFFYEYYRGEKKNGLQILLSYSQAGPGRKANPGQEEISHNHVPTFFSRLCTLYILI